MGEKKEGKAGSNVFTYTTGVVANEGVHTATVISTQYVGEKATIYGKKDFQMFHLRVTQPKVGGGTETADIHQQFHRSFHPQATLTKFLKGFGYTNLGNGTKIDFDDLVGKSVTIVVHHDKKSNGTVHANVTDTLPPNLPKQEPAQKSQSREERLLKDAERKLARLSQDYGDNEPIVIAQRKLVAELKTKTEGTCKN